MISSSFKSKSITNGFSQRSIIRHLNSSRDSTMDSFVFLTLFPTCFNTCFTVFNLVPLKINYNFLLLYIVLF